MQVLRFWIERNFWSVLFTRQSFLIWQTAFILSLSSVSLLVPIPGTEVCCWAQAQSQDQKTGQTDVKPQSQTPSAQQIIPGGPGKPSSGPAVGILEVKPEIPLKEQQPKQIKPDKTVVGKPPQTTMPPPFPAMPPAVPMVQPVSPATQPTIPIVQPASPATQPTAVPVPRRGLFTLNFDDADVYAIIQTIFGEALRVNYVVDPRVKGRVTFRAVAPVPMDNVLPLMEVILRLNGIGIVEDNGLYRIVPISDISKEPSPVSFGRDPEKIPVTGKSLLQVVPITYVQSSEVLKLIAPFSSNNAVLIDVPKGNQIIIVDTDANVKRMLKLVEIFDNEKLKQRKPQVFVYQVQNSKAKDIASLLQQIFMGSKTATPERTSASSRTGSASQAAPSSPSPVPAMSSHPQVSTILTGGEALVADFTRIIPDEITNTVVVLSTPEDYAAIKKTIEEIDIVPRQVVIEGMVASVTLTDNLSFGISGFLKGNPLDLDSKFILNPKALTVDLTKLSMTGFTFVGVDATGALRALITALATESKAKVLAAPHILVSDNREAKIQVGQQVPLITSETYGTPGVSPQRNFQYRDIGIILKVKPRINAGGLVSLELYQEISSFATLSPDSADSPLLINKTDVTTDLVVQDNQTIVIGGLIREDTTKSRSGIPLLSKIPIIGWLFGGTEDNATRHEIIILLTPRVIKNQKEAKDISAEFVDKMSESSKGGIKKEELIKEKQQKKEGVKPSAK
jgi:type II secretory pathway component GspD/PulD (secretin)